MTYEYRHVDVVRVIDGDTIRLDIDMGNCVRWAESFRLLGIDTPERGTPGAAEATAFLNDLVTQGLSRIVTHKPDKFGRWLVDVFVNSHEGGELHVNRMLVVSGHAAEYRGGARS